MVVSSKKILMEAKKKNVAIPQFNVNNLEWAKYILEQCNEYKNPVILGFSENAIKYIGGYEIASTMIRELDKELKLKIPVVIHLDHASSYESCKKAIDSGFTSVMIDASSYEYTKNIEIVKKVVSYAEKYSVTVEAELGVIGKEETSINNIEEFINKTNIDALAPAIGTEHGIYQKEPKINFELCEEINKIVSIPLVIHGASGLSKKAIKQLLNYGFCKININTELQVAWSNALKKYLTENKKAYDPRKIISSGESALKKVIIEKLNIISDN